MDYSGDYDAEWGSTPEEYAEMRAAETQEGYAVREDGSKPKVKLLTPSVKWFCQPKAKERKSRNDRTIQYFVQTIFTVRGNRVVLVYDAGTAPMPEGAGHGVVVEIFGRDVTFQPNDDKSETAFVLGAEVMKRRTHACGTGGTTPTPQKKAVPTAETVEKNRKLVGLRRKYRDIEQKLRWDDSEETRLAADLERLAVEIRRVEKGEDIAAEAELKALVREQHADDSDTVSEEIDQAITDADGDREILDHDDDGAELERSTEPWADSSIPLGATVDADCWDCPARLGAICQRFSAGQPCLMTA